MGIINDKQVLFSIESNCLGTYLVTKVFVANVCDNSLFIYQQY